MLALTRKKGEAIMIDGGIEICVIDMVGDKVKLGIKAPKNTNILRREVYESIKDSNEGASHPPLKDIDQLKHILWQEKHCSKHKS